MGNKLISSWGENKNVENKILKFEWSRKKKLSRFYIFFIKIVCYV